MLDLFGDQVTSPTTSPAKGVLNAAAGFPEFWAAWPAGIRKVGKQQALNKWATLGCASTAALILQHVEWLKAQDEWKRGFIPMPTTYLNQQRWIDWEAPKPVPQQPDALQKILSHKGAPMPESVRKLREALRQGVH